jgi:hypothetical protein
VNRDAAQAAADWWADRIRSVRPETDGLHAGLSREEAFAATAQIALRGAAIDAAPAVDDHTAQAFVTELAAIIAASEDGMVRLAVDYSPDQLLAQAADAAGVDRARFPGKTTMRVRADHVIAKAGYGAPWRLVWSAPSWEHPPCGVQDWPEDSADPIGPKCALPQWHEGGHDWA